jgi:hypothetical protein
MQLGPYCSLLNGLRSLLYLGLTGLCLYFSTYSMEKYLAAETIILTSAEVCCLKSVEQ